MMEKASWVSPASLTCCFFAHLCVIPDDSQIHEFVNHQVNQVNQWDQYVNQAGY